MAESSFRALVGLGNPGPDHARTRHNAGFWLADRIADEFRGTFRRETRFHGELAEVMVGDARLLLLKPQTWMNASGRAVQALMAFHKLAPAQVVVAHDELDLPPGVVRLKVGGGHGGHNGLRDVHAQVGAEYRRVRIGVGHPGSKDQVTDYLTRGRAGKTDQTLIDAAIDATVQALPLALENWEKATQQLHSRDNGAND